MQACENNQRKNNLLKHQDKHNILTVEIKYGPK